MLAALGLLCFATSSCKRQRQRHYAGRLRAVPAGAAMWAVSNIVVRRAQKETPEFDVISFIVWCGAVPIVPFVLLSLAFDDPATRWQWTSAPFTTWIAVAYIGWMSTIVGYAMWTRCSSAIPSTAWRRSAWGAGGRHHLRHAGAGRRHHRLAMGRHRADRGSLICTMFGGRWLDRHS
jgi:O-acetylserine/cysteine efflux transporter